MMDRNLAAESGDRIKVQILFPLPKFLVFITVTFMEANLDYLEELYEKFQKHPEQLDPSWHNFFQQLATEEKPLIPTLVPCQGDAQLRIYNLIAAYRTYGHLMADINPIRVNPIEEPWELQLANLGFSTEELEKLFPTCGLLSQEQAMLQQIIDRLKEIYCHKIGYEYMFLEDPKVKLWIQQKIEGYPVEPRLNKEQKKVVLEQLNHSELFESFIHIKYTGQKRFSLEGGETLIPMLKMLIDTGNQLGMEQFVIGMAHRGRLNVLSNILKKSHVDIFSEFEENYIPNSFEGSGDVKYHKGFSSTVQTTQGNQVQIVLAPNASHLESVDPIVEGQTKAKQIFSQDEKNQKKVVPILIHGDAALAGQGVVYETLEFNGLEGYSTGGTIHFVINNQIGFTALPQETRSTRYCTDIAKAFNAPVFHVNAEDPEGCVFVTNLAVEMRQKFHCDLFIDINCYRKYGHNESDEPAYTQPLEYQLIRKKKPIRELYRDQLSNEGLLEHQVVDKLEKEFTEGLQKALQEGKAAVAQKVQEETSKITADHFQKVETGVPLDILKTIAEKISSVPSDFNIHPKLHHLIKERLSMVTGDGSKLLDWGMAELLAYGSILWDKKNVRLSGQDSRRGTFSHRHAIWMDQQAEQAYFPLRHLKEDQGRFDVLNSHLSEYAVVGFEFGYSSIDLNGLTLWEAQFGDFSNGAQIMMDQYISTAEQKWGQKFGLTLLLPHGYEGQGPEHSSGRMERFLILCGNDNMRVANPTTPAQFFHLLRRQVVSPIRKPLVIFTPKGLLRHPVCVSPVQSLVTGAFEEILDDPKNQKEASVLVFCSGKIYYDLMQEREKRNRSDMALIRLEQLYPLNEKKLEQIIGNYSNIKACIWAQEEPSNMGAWSFIQPYLQPLLPKGVRLKYVGRRRSASPAVGSYALHKKEYAELMAALFEVK